MARVLGIDPGSKLTGWGVIESDGSVFSYLDSGIIDCKKVPALPDRLLMIHDALEEICTKYAPDYVAIEDTFAHKFFKASLVLAQAQAIALLVARRYNAEVRLIQSKTVKKVLTGNGNAEKEFVNQQLKFMIPNIDFTTNDASDAVALALTCSMTVGTCSALAI